MTDVLGSAWQTVAAFLSQLWTTLQGFAARLGLLEWAALAAGLLVLVLLAVLLRRRHDEPNRNRPEVLVSLGAISASEGFDAESGVLLPKRFVLKMTVSNLNTYPVQALELALKTPEMELPVTAELATLIPPEASVVIEETLPELVGDEGKLNLYLYAANSSKKTYRLQTAFALEPWNARYKISPLGQSIAVTRQLASMDVTRRQERAWRERGSDERSMDRPRDPQPSASAQRGSWNAPSLRRERDASGESGKPHPTQASGARVYDSPEEGKPREQTSFPDEF